MYLKRIMFLFIKMNNKFIQRYANPLMINTKGYEYVVNKLTEFFKSKKFLEVSRQNSLGTLVGCDDPFNVETFSYGNDDHVWPLPQSREMLLEYEILKHPEIEGYFCLTTSYRLEKRHNDRKHYNYLPLFNFETHGNIYDLAKLERELLNYLGYNKDDIKMATYEEMQEKYEVENLEDKHEEKMETDIGKAVLLHDFPEEIKFFWNLKCDIRTKSVRKIDVILSGQRTISSAEKEDDKDTMKRRFKTIMNGKYKEKLYELFGEERTNKELEYYLNHDFFERIGGCIDITTLIRSMKKENLI